MRTRLLSHERHGFGFESMFDTGGGKSEGAQSLQIQTSVCLRFFFGVEEVVTIPIDDSSSLHVQIPRCTMVCHFNKYYK